MLRLALRDMRRQRALSRPCFLHALDLRPGARSPPSSPIGGDGRGVTRFGARTPTLRRHGEAAQKAAAAEILQEPLTSRLLSIASTTPP